MTALIVGVDEVGRGPLAGPVVACACFLPPDLHAPWLADLADSKALKPATRERLAARIKTHALFAVAEASVAEIDALNIRNATLLAMRRAVERLQPTLPAGCTVVVDGNVAIPELLLPQRTQVKADATVKAVSAASIVAKVYRDALMAELHAAYPHYGWARNAGYGTALHLQGLQHFGPTPHHRTTFAPVREAMAAWRHATPHAA